MKKTDNKKNNPASDPEQKTTLTRKRGRPAGSKNKTKTLRPNQTVQADPGENTKCIQFNMELMSLPAIDINNPVQVNERITEYFRITSQYDYKPSVAALALAFQCSRYDLFNWLNGRSKVISNPESILTLKRAYNGITAYYENMMNTGKINPVAGIFLMKNNFGYQDNTVHTIQTNENNGYNITDITEKAGLLDDID